MKNANQLTLQLTPVWDFKRIFDLTNVASQHVESLIRQLDAKQNDKMAEALESEICLVIERWQSAVRARGGEPKGLWIVDFPRDESSVFCWKFPETALAYAHPITLGFASRQPIGDSDEKR